MDVHERRQAVKALLAKDPQMGGRSIARLLGVPQTTIRRDLAWLAAGAGAAQSVPQGVTPPVRGGNSAAARRLIAALDAELAANAAAAGTTLECSAAEEAVLQLIADGVDRREELAADYAAAANVNVKVKLATELRLIEGGVARLFKQVSTAAPGPQSAVSRKASHAANTRWRRYHMGQGGA